MKINVYWYEKVTEKSAYPPIMIKSEALEVPLYKTDGFGIEGAETVKRNTRNLYMNINAESPSFDFVAAYLPDGYGISPIFTTTAKMMEIIVDSILEGQL